MCCLNSKHLGAFLAFVVVALSFDSDLIREQKLQDFELSKVTDTYFTAQHVDSPGGSQLHLDSPARSSCCTAVL